MLSATLALLVMQGSTDDCLGFVSDNLARGNDNFFTYYRFSDAHTKIQPGDVLVYDILLDPKNPMPKGGIDVEFSAGLELRDRDAHDQDGLRAHGDALLTKAVGTWITRRIPLDSAVGETTEGWNAVFEGDATGRYCQFLDNIRIERHDAKTFWVFSDGLPTARQLKNTNGYSRFPLLASIPRAETTDVEKAKADVVRTAERIRSLDKARQDIQMAKQFLDQNPDIQLQGHIEEATAALDKIERNANATTQEVEAALHMVNHALQHTHPVMEQYTGHLVGHAHIDLMWLWEWQEGIVATHDTFNQAVKFMNEFPGFTFSQSSSAIYQTIEQNYPDLFKKIKEKVKKGQWEIVGGRVDEGDTNMISPESHARHFLYGQRYFRNTFGKTATVGWEPDTFGHAITMPQIAKLGGLTSYYFCRGGKGKPLFWWEGLDGTKLLTFDEPSSGSWYNSDLSYQQFQEMLDFKKKVGSKDMLWVYGVGNHGGGPTREMIEEALTWMKDKTKPKVKFSTATQFFDKLRTYDLNKIPVIKDELNPVFEGCYTTHSEVKQLNRYAEYATSTAEAVSTVASMFGFPYPKTSFQRNWEDITFNHHHDTLPGSFIHPSSDKTVNMLQRVLADDKDIAQRAMETLTLRVTPKYPGTNLMVFNPNGWVRSGWVDAYAWYANLVGETVAVAPDGKETAVIVTDPELRKVRFWAESVPPFGYKVFHIRKPEPGPISREPAEPYGFTTDIFDNPAAGQAKLQNGAQTAFFDLRKGTIVRLYDEQSHRDLVPTGGSMARLELHHEQPNGMSAWTLGPVDKISELPVVDVQHGDDWIRFTHRIDSMNNPGKPTTVTQTFTLLPGSDKIDVDVDCDWNGIGTDQTGGPLLRVAFDTNLVNPTATYEVPFGAIARPADGSEVVGLNWQDLSTPDYGVAVLNDSKSGMSADGSTMRLSLIRSSQQPDTNPNPGRHHWRYAIVPHKGDWKAAAIPQKGFEFQQPMLVATVPNDAKGSNPLEWSPLNLTDGNVLATALKRSEDGNDLILRAFQATGATSNGSVRLNLPTAKADWVNFVEDKLGAATLQGTLLPFALHGFEIRTVKLKTK